MRDKYGSQKGKKVMKTTKDQIDYLIEKANSNGITLTKSTVRWRLDYGWSTDEILTTPKGERRKVVT